MKGSRTLDEKAVRILDRLPAKTPDGVPYTFASVRAAIANWEG